MAGCSSKRTTSPIVVPVQTESTTRAIHTVTFEIAHASLPQQSLRHTTRDSTSHLETDYAISDAGINEDGSLFHSLINKNDSIPVLVPVTHDTVVIAKCKEIPVPVPEIKEVERDFSWWERFRLQSFWYLSSCLLVILIFVCRKPLVSIISKIIRC